MADLFSMGCSNIHYQQSALLSSNRTSESALCDGTPVAIRSFSVSEVLLFFFNLMVLIRSMYSLSSLCWDDAASTQGGPYLTRWKPIRDVKLNGVMLSDHMLGTKWHLKFLLDWIKCRLTEMKEAVPSSAFLSSKTPFVIFSRRQAHGKPVFPSITQLRLEKCSLSLCSSPHVSISHMPHHPLIRLMLRVSQLLHLFVA